VTTGLAGTTVMVAMLAWTVLSTIFISLSPIGMD